MVKKKRIKKGNLFNIGGPIQGLGIKPVTPQFNPFERAKKGLSDILSGVGSELLTSAAMAADSAIGGAIGGGLSTGIGDLMSQVPGLGIAGGIVNRLFGSKINDAAVTNFKNQNQQLANTILDSSSNSSLLSGYANTELLGEINKSDVGKDGVFSNKASRLTKNLNAERELATDRFFSGLENSINNARANELFGVNKAAYGGPLTMRYTGTMSPFGNTFADGGNLITNGAEWDNGLTIIGNGGTHEENPMEGVQMGVDAQGIPNLVEEGEVIFNDYVFSNRLTVPNAVKEKYKLRGNKKLTFADAAKQVQKESEERPNDPISKRGLMSSMSRLLQAQEVVRQQNQVNQGGAQYAHGGILGRLFDGLGPDENFLELSRGAHLYGDSVPDNTEVAAPSIYDTNGILTPEGLATSRAAHLGVPISEIQTIDADANSQGNTGGNTNTNNSGSNLTWLRYAPVVGATIGLGQNIFSKPDYSSSDATLNAANEAGRYTPVGFNPPGDYLIYRPFDRNYYINKLNAQSGATRRAIVNQSAGNRATALAGLLAADYNTQGKLGDLARQAEEYNLGQRERVATFNRGTNQFNSEMGLKAAMANQEAALKARSQRLSGVAQAMQVRDAVDARRSASMSANLTNLFNSIGDIGREEYSRNMIMSNPALYYSIDNNGNISYKKGYENLSEAEKEEVRKSAEKAKSKKANGGYLTIRKGGRYA